MTGDGGWRLDELTRCVDIAYACMHARSNRILSIACVLLKDVVAQQLRQLIHGKVRV